MTNATVIDATLAAEVAFNRRQSDRRRDSFLRGFSVVMFFVVWEAFAQLNSGYLKLFNPILLPPPQDVALAGWKMLQTGELQRDIAASLWRVFCGFLMASVVGVAAGMIVSRSKTLSALFEPIVDMLRPIPSLAFLPMLVLWLGIGDLSKIAFIAYATFFPVFTTTLQGVRHIDRVLLRAAASLGASRFDTFRYVELQAAFPSIITGLRLGFSQAFLVIVAAEFIAADSGLGYLINDSRTFFDMPRMLLGATVIGLIGFIFSVLLGHAEARLLRWHTGTRG